MPVASFRRPLEKPSRIWYIYTRFNKFFKNLKGKLSERTGRKAANPAQTGVVGLP